jgi:hypothetical protein
MPGIDEAFMPFWQIVERMLSFTGEIDNPAAGVRSYIYRCEIDSPVELDVVRDVHGVLHIGSTPPLYYLNTTFLPAFHRLRFAAELSEARHGE